MLSALSLAGSVLLSSNANGIAVFMLFGAGLTAGLLGQIGEALGSRTLDRVADIVSWVLPFEALYQAALSAITADTVGFTRLAISLGPFGGAEEAGPLLWPWTLVYLGAGGRRRLGRLRAARLVSSGRDSGAPDMGSGAPANRRCRPSSLPTATMTGNTNRRTGAGASRISNSLR